jgi:hypothetical protein
LSTKKEKKMEIEVSVSFRYGRQEYHGSDDGTDDGGDTDFC